MNVTEFLPILLIYKFASFHCSFDLSPLYSVSNVPFLSIPKRIRTWCCCYDSFLGSRIFATVVPQFKLVFCETNICHSEKVHKFNLCLYIWYYSLISLQWGGKFSRFCQLQFGISAIGLIFNYFSLRALIIRACNNNLFVLYFY